MIAGLLLSALLAAGNPQGVDIEASLHGYNLLWPSKRCCAFELHVAAVGHATVKAEINTGPRPKTWAREFALTHDQMLRFRDSVYEVGFFNVPDDICCGPLDGDERAITVTIGDRKHRVTFQDNAAPNQMSDLRRAEKLWSVLRALVQIPNENVH